MKFNPLAFPAVQDFDARVPVWCLTPHEGRCIHRFFDTCPISPSGRYIALFRFPHEQRLNKPGEVGHIVLVDLLTGEERVVAKTRGWEFQLGANINWGASDDVLVYNDVDTQTWKPMLVRLNPLTGKRDCIYGGVYHVSPDGRYAASCSLEKMMRTQFGYGVLLPQDRVGRNIGAPDDDGLFITNLETGERRLALSLSEVVHKIPELDDSVLTQWEVYGFHSKWSPSGERLIFTVRRFPVAGGLRHNLIASHDPDQQIRYDVLTVKPDGSDIHNAVPAVAWANGGHHVNWFPDSKRISMNLGGFGDGLKFVQTDYQGHKLSPLLLDVVGSGHPTVHPNGSHILTDAYENEPMADADKRVPLRWISLSGGSETHLLHVGVRTEPQPTNVLRVDPHPAWDRSWRYVVFNGVARHDNTRRVFMADLESLIA